MSGRGRRPGRPPRGRSISASSRGTTAPISAPSRAPRAVDVTRPGAVVNLGCEPAAAGESPEVTAMVERAKTGDADAFSELVRLYEGRIIAIGRAMGPSREGAPHGCHDDFGEGFRYLQRLRSRLV